MRMYKNLSMMYERGQGCQKDAVESARLNDMASSLIGRAMSEMTAKHASFY
jgi:TPR repeat protein